MSSQQNHSGAQAPRNQQQKIVEHINTLQSIADAMDDEMLAATVELSQPKPPLPTAKKNKKAVASAIREIKERQMKENELKKKIEVKTDAHK